MKKTIFILGLIGMLFLFMACSDTGTQPVEQGQNIRVNAGQSVLLTGSLLGKDFLIFTYKGASELFYCPIISYTTTAGTHGALWLPSLTTPSYSIKMPSGKTITIYQVSGQCNTEYLTITFTER